jgi:hypothetical protein
MLNVVNKIMMCLVGMAIGAVLMPRASIAQSASVPKREDTVAAGASDCSDRNSKVTKQQWMELMAAEFDRLDKNKTGQIELAEPTNEKERPKLPNRPFSFFGK